MISEFIEINLGNYLPRRIKRETNVPRQSQQTDWNFTCHWPSKVTIIWVDEKIKHLAPKEMLLNSNWKHDLEPGYIHNLYSTSSLPKKSLDYTDSKLEIPLLLRKLPWEIIFLILCPRRQHIRRWMTKRNIEVRKLHTIQAKSGWRGRLFSWLVSFPS